MVKKEEKRIIDINILEMRKRFQFRYGLVSEYHTTTCIHPMKPQSTPCTLLTAFLALGITMGASAAQVTVSSTETWDGVSNPHAADGVTLSGSGTEGDPFTYTIPNGMHITSAGTIVLDPPGDNNDYSIQFIIHGGDLQMDAGAIINIERYQIRSGQQFFTLDLGGANSITGAGQIGPITSRDSNPRVLTIQNVNNLSMTNIDLHTENVNLSANPYRNMHITARGAVVITGKVDNSDQDTSGDGGADIVIEANTINVNQLDTRGMRTDGSAYNGNVDLQALSPLGGYSVGDNVDNAFTNKLTVNGLVTTAGGGTYAGNVTMYAVAMQFSPGFSLQMPALASPDLEVGVVRDGASASDLFVDASGSGLTVQNTVQWGGTATLPPGSPPAFTTKPLTRPNATQDVAYASTIAGSATDPDLDPLTYYKGQGPAWLQVALDGTLSGTPALTDAGTNSWTVAVSDGTRFDTTTLTIFVVAGPRFTTNSLTYPNAAQNTPYSGTLNQPSTIIYYGSATLSFAKLTGPAWLTVASNGTLSGTPAPTNTFANAWTVSVTDGTWTNTATLNIFVNGSPQFTANPIVGPSDRIGTDISGVEFSLALYAVDPQSSSLSFYKVSGPAWLTINGNGTLSGIPTNLNFGTNTWTIGASDGTYPDATGTLTVNVLPATRTGPVVVSSQETWDGYLNPHAADGVTLTSSGSPTLGGSSTYTIPGGLHITGAGSIYINPNGDTNLQSVTFDITNGDLTMDTANNLINTAVRNRTSSAIIPFILDLGGTNNIFGSGQIIGLIGSKDTPRVLTIRNVNNVQMANINNHVENVNNDGINRPMNITAAGTVVFTGKVDNSDQDTGGNGAANVTILANAITVNNVNTYSVRTSGGGRYSGNITLVALAAPQYSPANGVYNNAFTNGNKLTILGTLDSTNAMPASTTGYITNQAVVVQLGGSARLLYPPTVSLDLEAGNIQSPASALDLFINQSGMTLTPLYDVQWSGNIIPTFRFGAAAPGYISLNWGGTNYTLQTNSNLGNPNGWGNVPGNPASPATFPIQPGNVFYRLKQ